MREKTGGVTPAIIIRPLTPDDWKIFKEIRLQALKTHPGFFLTSYEETRRFPEQKFKDILDGKEKCVFGLFDGGFLIGVTGVVAKRQDPSGQSAEMVMSFLRPEYRGKGLSRLMYQARIDWALSQPQFLRLYTGHREDNDPSRHANQAFGFTFVEKELEKWPDGQEKHYYKYVLDLEALRKEKKP